MNNQTDDIRLHRMSEAIAASMRKLANGECEDVRTEAEKIKQMVLLLAKPAKGAK